MKKTLILSLAAIAFFSCKKSSTNTPSPNSVKGVYAAGYEQGSSTYIAKYWKDGTEVKLSDGTKAAYASSIVVSGSDVYVAGYEKNANGNDILLAKYWKNAVPINLTDGSRNAIASSITVVGSDVYVAGYESNGTKLVAKYWKNGAVVNLSNGSTNYFTNAIAVNGSGVHVAGSVAAFSIADKAYWKNSVFTDLPSSSYGETNTVVVSQNNVYIGGSDGQKAVYWKDGVKNALSNNLSAVEHINSIFVFAGKVYCGGYSDLLGSGEFVATVWSPGTSTDLNTATKSKVNSIYVVN